MTELEAKYGPCPKYRCDVRGEWLIFYCPICRSNHQHPAATYLEPNALAHRIAHCLTETGKAFHKNGYYIFYARRNSDQLK